jgi:hypothetical protein
MTAIQTTIHAPLAPAAGVAPAVGWVLLEGAPR